MNRWERLCAFVLQRLSEPSTWAGIVTVVTGLGVSVSPERRDAIATIGTTIAGLLLMVAREGRSLPDNPSLPATIKGEMPDQKPPIVTPPPVSDLPTTKIDPKHVAIEPDGTLKADPPA